ncbi:MAG: DUF2933 domain-containing protein [Burkholderiaceae bacterium]
MHAVRTLIADGMAPMAMGGAGSLACPLMHLFHGHRGHHGHERPDDNNRRPGQE